MIKKNILLPLLFVAVFFSCKKEQAPPPEFKYNYSINKNMYMDSEILVDSLTYFYNSDDVLLKVGRCSSGALCTEYVVSYYPDHIDNWNGDYYFDEEYRVTVINNSGQITEFEYEEDKRVYEKLIIENIIIQEAFYEYQNDNLFKDSVVMYENDGHAYSTVSQYLYTDTLRPFYMVDYSGLHEIPPYSNYLVKEVVSESYTDSIKQDNYSVYKYHYDIEERKTSQHIDFFDKNGSKDKSLKIEYTIDYK